MSTALGVLTVQALTQALGLQEYFKQGLTIYAPKRLRSKFLNPNQTVSSQPADRAMAAVTWYEESFGAMLSKHFQAFSQWILIMAAGIAVRSLALCLRDKSTDPAVVVMDEKLTYAIPLLGGHVAGANRLARYLQAQAGAQAVITTATDVQQTGAADLLAQALGDYQPSERLAYLRLNAALAAGEGLTLGIDLLPQAWFRAPALETSSWERFQERQRQKIELLAGDALRGFTVYSHFSKAEAPDLLQPAQVWVSCRRAALSDSALLRIVPPALYLGVGCRKGAAPGELWEQVKELLDTWQIEPRAIRALASIDLKSQEPAILALAQRLQIPFQTFPASRLAQLCHKHHLTGSPFVMRTVETPAVAEPAALAAAGPDAELVLGRQAKAGITLALAWALPDLAPCLY